MSAFTRALGRAHATANRLAGVTVIYRRGGSQVELIATIGSTRIERGDTDGAIVRQHVRDYILTVAELNFGGTPFLPLEGDQILETVGAATFVMEVRAPVSEAQHYQWHGPAHDAIRVHTKQSATEPI